MKDISSIVGPNGESLPGARSRALSASVGAMRTAFDAADPMSQELALYRPLSGSADRDLLYEQRLIVDRIRHMVANNGWASGAVSREVDHVIGANFRPEPTPNWRALGISPQAAADLADEMLSEYNLAALDPGLYIDATRHDTLPGLYGLMYRDGMSTGERIALILWRQRGGRYATCLQVIDPDRLSNPYGQPDDDHLRGGVALDDDGAPVGYWFRKGHPRDVGLSAIHGFEWEYVPKETPWGRPMVIHSFDRLRPGQHRGLSEFASVLKNLKMFDAYAGAELSAALLNATLAAFIESPFDHDFLMETLEDPQGKKAFGAYQDLRSDYHKDRAVTFGGTVMPKLFPGEKIGFYNPARPSSQMDAFSHVMLRNITAALPAHTAETVTLDYSKTNYSGARAGLVVAGRSVLRKRITFGYQVATQVYNALMEEAFMTGRLKTPPGAPSFDEAREAYLQTDWIGPASGWVDPVKEAQAAMIRVNGRLSTLRDECADQGTNWRDNMDQLAREQAYAKQLGLPDPNLKVSMSVKAPTDDERPSASARVEDYEAWAADFTRRIEMRAAQ